MACALCDRGQHYIEVTYIPINHIAGAKMELIELLGAGWHPNSNLSTSNRSQL
jgi:hypothetical protein